MKDLLIEKKYPNATLPTRGTYGSAGLDLYAYLENPVIIGPGHIVNIGTGVGIGIGDNAVVGLVYGRSGLGAKHGITLANCVGVIDSDYTGEITVSLTNHTQLPYTVEPGHRIAQLVLTPVYTPQLKEVDSLPTTQRGDGGHGSSGL